MPTSSVHNSGELNNRSGSSLVNDGQIFNDGGFTIDVGGALSGAGTYAQTAGTTTVNGTFAQSDILISGGSLGGTGQITGNVTVSRGFLLRGLALGPFLCFFRLLRERWIKLVRTRPNTAFGLIGDREIKFDDHPIRVEEEQLPQASTG